MLREFVYNDVILKVYTGTKRFKTSTLQRYKISELLTNLQLAQPNFSGILNYLHSNYFCYAAIF